MCLVAHGLGGGGAIARLQKVGRGAGAGEAKREEVRRDPVKEAGEGRPDIPSRGNAMHLPLPGREARREGQACSGGGNVILAVDGSWISAASEEEGPACLVHTPPPPEGSVRLVFMESFVEPEGVSRAAAPCAPEAKVFGVGPVFPPLIPEDKGSGATVVAFVDFSVPASRLAGGREWDLPPICGASC